MKKAPLWVPAILLSFVSSFAANAADLKIGVVDMDRAFQEFFKTKDATAMMKVNREKVAQDMNERYATYRTRMSDVQAKQKATQDPILTEEGRAKATAEMQNLLKEVRSLENEISEFQQRRSMQLRQEELDLTRGIYQEITDAVKKKAAADNYDYIFDKSGKGINNVPFLIHAKSAIDFTDEVIVELNKAAPKPTTEPKAEATKAK